MACYQVKGFTRNGRRVQGHTRCTDRPRSTAIAAAKLHSGRADYPILQQQEERTIKRIRNIVRSRAYESEVQRSPHEKVLNLSGRKNLSDIATNLTRKIPGTYNTSTLRNAMIQDRSHALYAELAKAGKRRRHRRKVY